VREFESKPSRGAEHNRIFNTTPITHPSKLQAGDGSAAMGQENKRVLDFDLKCVNHVFVFIEQKRMDAEVSGRGERENRND
jgi:hypothetical protein